MAVYNRAEFAEVLFLDGDDLDDNYTDFDETTQSVSDIFIMQNLTDIAVMVSFDGGATDHLPVASDSYILLDLNRFIVDRSIMLPKGLTISARALNTGDTASTGDLWVSIVTSKRN